LPLLYGLSLLPFTLLYLLSDFFFFLMYHVAGYRKKVVYTNLANAFPQKTKTELQQITSAYYKYLCDLFLETFKTLTISRRQMLKHCPMHPDALALFNQLAAEKRSVILVMGHQGNWEWAGNTFSLVCPQPLYVIYHAIANPYFNGLVYGMRTRFGTRLIEMNDTFRAMVSNRKEVNATAFIADQTPDQPHLAYWTQFMNQDTPVFWGTEKIARKLNQPVVYVQVKKIKRGYYEVCADMLEKEPASTAEGAISEQHIRRLEADIIRQPETWLWSHKRWKHKR
jgi:KDO2-lipid IV(A) lauroyltransferase